MRQRRDVVDDVRAFQRRAPHHLGLARVDRQAGAAPLGERGDHRQDAPALLLEVHGVGAGPGRLPADVEDVGPLRLEPQRVRDRGVRGAVAAAVGEAVGRHVDDPHDARPIERKTGDGGTRLGEALHQGLQAAIGGAVQKLDRAHNAASDAPAIAFDDLGPGKAQIVPPRHGNGMLPLPFAGGRCDAADGANI